MGDTIRDPPTFLIICDESITACASSVSMNEKKKKREGGIASLLFCPQSICYHQEHDQNEVLSQVLSGVPSSSQAEALRPVQGRQLTLWGFSAYGVVAGAPSSPRLPQLPSTSCPASPCPFHPDQMFLCSLSSVSLEALTQMKRRSGGQVE